MRSKFKINNEEINTFLFPGGEVAVNIPNVMKTKAKDKADFKITAQIVDAVGVMSLIMLTNAIDARFDNPSRELVMPYIPYQQQDRICNAGEAFSIKVFAGLLNDLNYSKVSVWDPHSLVAPALINNVRVVHQDEIVGFDGNLACKIKNGMTLVAPDLGASKKMDRLSKLFKVDYIQGIKQRDLATGNLSGFDYYGDVEGKDLLIVDDICVGGGTFIGLSDKLRAGGAKSVSLYITHGIFSKGLSCFRGKIDNIYTTNSIPQESATQWFTGDLKVIQVDL